MRHVLPVPPQKSSEQLAVTEPFCRPRTSSRSSPLEFSRRIEGGDQRTSLGVGTGQVFRADLCDESPHKCSQETWMVAETNALVRGIAVSPAAHQPSKPVRRRESVGGF